MGYEVGAVRNRSLPFEAMQTRIPNEIIHVSLPGIQRRHAMKSNQGRGTMAKARFNTVDEYIAA